MKKPTLFSAILCSIVGHRFEVSKQVTKHVKEYTCSCCRKELTTNGNGNLTELTPKFKEINSILERIHEKRMARLNQGRVYNTQRQIEGLLNSH